MAKKPETNAQLVVQMMEYSRFGAVAQMLIIDALTKQIDAVAKSKVSDYPPEMMMMVSPQTWIDTAKDLKKQMDVFYGRHTEPEQKVDHAAA